MNASRFLATVAAALTFAVPAAAAEGPTVIPAAHEELTRAFDDLAGQIHNLGARWREHFTPGDRDGERPLITIALSHRAELGLSAQQRRWSGFWPTSSVRRSGATPTCAWPRWTSRASLGWQPARR